MQQDACGNARDDGAAPAAGEQPQQQPPRQSLRNAARRATEIMAQNARQTYQNAGASGRARSVSPCPGSPLPVDSDDAHSDDTQPDFAKVTVNAKFKGKTAQITIQLFDEYLAICKGKDTQAATHIRCGASSLVSKCIRVNS